MADQLLRGDLFAKGKTAILWPRCNMEDEGLHVSCIFQMIGLKHGKGN